jgi:hypothetical protein
MKCSTSIIGPIIESTLTAVGYEPKSGGTDRWTQSASGSPLEIEQGKIQDENSKSMDGDYARDLFWNDSFGQCAE